MSDSKQSRKFIESCGGKTGGGGSSSSSKVDVKLMDALKHYDSFYEKPPPGLIKEREEERPEDVIPDTPENSAAREFLAKAPTKGLWMPLGKEVKVMKCWRCKNYGHRTGDKECPMFLSGNKQIEEFRHAHEDPMYNFVKESEIQQKLEKVEILKSLLQSKHKHKKKRFKNKHNKHKHHKKIDTKSDSRKRTPESDSDSNFSSSSSSSSTSSCLSSDSSSDNRKTNRKRKHKHKHRKHQEHRDHKKHRK